MNRKHILIGVGSVLLIGVVLVGIVLGVRYFQQKKTTKLAATTPSAKPNTISPDSEVVTATTSSQFILRSNADSLYTSTSSTGEAAAREFIEKGTGQDGEKLFPDAVAKQLTQTDARVDGKGKIKPKTPTAHYSYRQDVSGIPVYGANIRVHIRNGNEIYAAEGKTLTNTTFAESTVATDDAAMYALAAARGDNPGYQLQMEQSEPWIVNLKLAGLSDDESNHYTQAITVASVEQGGFRTIYYIDLSTRTIILEESLLHTARDRRARDGRQCSSSTSITSCKILRAEQNPAIGDKEVDGVFDTVGSIYTFFNDSYGLDSFDGKGSPLELIPRYPMAVAGSGGTSYDCRNAFWYPDYNMLAVCEGMGANDVLTHEYMHGVTIAASGLKFIAQSGAINEAVSDLMSTAMDDDWNIGEDSRLGIIRVMNDPPQKKHPDRLFSSLYYCPATAQCTSKNDYCGVHYNSGVLNKTGYLIAEGGTFNGCTITGIGKEKMQAIVYHATTDYLNASSNYKEIASALTTACADLYDNTDCATVTRAIQATEMDQQVLGSQLGPTCSGKTAKKPACAGTSPTQGTATTAPTISASTSPVQGSPTVAPISKPAGSPTTVPTKPPTSGGGTTVKCVPRYKPDKNGCEQPTIGSPGTSATQGNVTFSWCTSTPQAGFNFRLDYGANNAGKPDVVKDRIKETSVTLEMPLGKHAWWVHSFCQDGGNGYLSTPTGQDLSVVRKSSTSGGSSGGSTSTTPPAATPTQASSGVNQGTFERE